MSRSWRVLGDDIYIDSPDRIERGICDSLWTMVGVLPSISNHVSTPAEDASWLPMVSKMAYVMVDVIGILF